MDISDSNTSNKISSLHDLVQLLYQGDFDLVTKQLADTQFAAGDFEPYTFWTEERYTRNCIAHNDSFELVLLCWQAGQETAIHCHDEKECWVKVLEGTFEEKMFATEDFEKVVPTGVRTLAPFEVTNANEPTFFHSLKNTSDDIACTLHLYMKPIKQCRIYNEGTQEMKLVEMQYDTLEGKVVS